MYVQLVLGVADNKNCGSLNTLPTSNDNITTTSTATTVTTTSLDNVSVHITDHHVSECSQVSIDHYPEVRIMQLSWWRSIVVRPPVLAGELSLPCARLTAGRVTTLWVKRPLSVNQHGQLSQPSLRVRLNE